MAVFRVERNKGYTVMSNHHLRNKELSLKANIWAENRRKERGGSRFAVHLASFLRLMAANLRAYPETNDEPG